MFKKLALALLVCLVAATAVTLYSPEAEAQVPNQSFGICYAYTVCPYSNQTIFCRVQGSSANGVACSWYVVPGVSVACNGYINTGYGWMWQTYYYTC